jgi:ubiquinone/menaquinone biosynthesis C-methylase UbiE
VTAARDHQHEHHGRHFDEIAGEYNASLPSAVVAHYLRRRIALLERLVAPPGPVLDAGCGTGMLLWGMAQRGYQVTGIDPSLGMLQQTPRDTPAALLQASAGNLPFAEGAFPLVVSVAVFHHLVDPALVADAVREMVRVTAPGGATVVWDHNPRNPYWPYLMARVPQDQEPTRLVPQREITAPVSQDPTLSIACTYHGWVPDFAPSWSLPLAGMLERVLEALPVVRERSAHNVVVIRKSSGTPASAGR